MERITYAEFPSTQWSVVASLDANHPAFRETLSGIIHRYWRPVYGYLLNLQRVSPDEAIDLTQAFFTRMLQNGYFERLSPERGSLRGYLKTALRNFSINAAKSEQTRRTPGGSPMIHIDREETAALAPIAATGTPEEVFDREWARGILHDCIGRLRRRLARDGKTLYFQMFSEYYLHGASVAGLAEKHGVARHDVTNHLRTARDLLRRLLKARLEEYLGPADDPEQELLFLLSQ